MKEYAENMIADSDRFDDPVQSLFEKLDKNKSFSYRVSADLYPQLQWKAPYKDFQVITNAVPCPASMCLSTAIAHCLL